MKGEMEMMKLMNYVKGFVKENEEGQAITEYALIIGLIVLVAIVAISALGDSIKAVFESLVAALTG